MQGAGASEGAVLGMPPQRANPHPPNQSPTRTQDRYQELVAQHLAISQVPGAEKMHGSDGQHHQHPHAQPLPLLAGKVALVTGATSGLGLEVACELARLGCQVLFGVRNEAKAERVAGEIRKRVPEARLIYPPAIPCVDFARNESVAAFAADLNSRTDLPLHILVNNAGTAGSGLPGRRNEEGIVDIVQTNYLGPYALTRALEGKLIACHARVVNVSSVTHRCFTLPDDPSKFLTSPIRGTYAHTKAANVLFAYELQRQYGSRGLQACAVDPGGVRTSIWDGISWPGVQWTVNATYAPPSDAAQAVVHAATVPWELEAPGILPSEDLRFYARGMFASPLICNIDGAWRRWVGAPVASAYGALVVLHSLVDWPIRRLSGGKYMSTVMLVPSAKQTYDRQLAAALWDVSEAAVGIHPTTPRIKAEAAEHFTNHRRDTPASPAHGGTAAVPGSPLRGISTPTTSRMAGAAAAGGAAREDAQGGAPGGSEPPAAAKDQQPGSPMSPLSSSARKRPSMSPVLPMPPTFRPLATFFGGAEEVGAGAGRRMEGGVGGGAGGGREHHTAVRSLLGGAAAGGSAPHASPAAAAGDITPPAPAPVVAAPAESDRRAAATARSAIAAACASHHVPAVLAAVGNARAQRAWLNEVPNPVVPGQAAGSGATGDAPAAGGMGVGVASPRAMNPGPVFTEELAKGIVDPQPKRPHVAPHSSDRAPSAAPPATGAPAATKPPRPAAPAARHNGASASGGALGAFEATEGVCVLGAAAPPGVTGGVLSEPSTSADEAGGAKKKKKGKGKGK